MQEARHATVALRELVPLVRLEDQVIDPLLWTLGEWEIQEGP